MVYISEKKKVKDLLDNKVIPMIKKKDVDYNKLVDAVCKETGSTQRLVKEILQTAINTNQIKEIRVLTIPDEELDDFFQEHYKEEKRIVEDDKEVDEVLDGVVKK